MLEKDANSSSSSNMSRRIRRSKRSRSSERRRNMSFRMSFGQAWGASERERRGHWAEMPLWVRGRLWAVMCYNVRVWMVFKTIC